jgi:hypothetical protein
MSVLQLNSHPGDAGGLWCLLELVSSSFQCLRVHTRDGVELQPSIILRCCVQFTSLSLSAEAMDMQSIVQHYPACESRIEDLVCYVSEPLTLSDELASTKSRLETTLKRHSIRLVVPRPVNHGAQLENGAQMLRANQTLELLRLMVPIAVITSCSFEEILDFHTQPLLFACVASVELHLALINVFSSTERVSAVRRERTRSPMLLRRHH